MPQPFPWRTVSVLVLALFFKVTGKSGNHPPEFYAAYPPIEEVVEWFREEIGLVPSGLNEYEFHKHPDGYSVVAVAYDDNLSNQLHEPVLIWSSARQKFQVPSQKELKCLGQPGGLDDLAQVLGPALREKVIYDENIFYGYEGWENEVIAELEDNPHKDARLWYGLGRAYSALATGILDGRHSSTRLHPYDISLDPAEFTEVDLDRYEATIRKSIQAMNKAAEMDPLMPVIVGLMAHKAINQHMTAWLDLSVIGEHERAARFLKPDLYPASSLAVARNLLMSCEPNGILFVNGDFDTYTPCYLQAQYQYRTDVTVVNLSLLNTARYIYYLKTILPPGERAPISLPKSEYIGKVNDFKMVEKGHSVEFFGEPPVLPDYEGDGDRLWDVFPVRGRGEDSSYLIKQDWVLLHIIQENAWKRPVYFSFGVESKSRLGLEPLCRVTGLAAQLSPYEIEPPQLRLRDGYEKLEGAFLPDPNFDLMIHQFDYPGFERTAGGPDKLIDPSHIGTYKLRFHRLLASLNAANDHDRFRIALQKYLALFPPEASTLKNEFLGMDAFYAAEMGFHEEAERMFAAARSSIEELVGSLKAGKGSAEDYRVAYYLAVSLYETSRRMERPEDREFLVPVFKYLDGRK